MRRDLKVNAEQESPDAPGQSCDFGGLHWPGGDEGPESSDIAPARGSSGGTHGTCLYFGPAGQRCDRPAGESGFCPAHLGNMQAKIPAKSGRIIAAVMAILALLWPVLGDVVQFIMRWIRQHHGF